MKIVAFGGGTGLSILLRGLKKYTNEITAVVTVADNGGGSGILREDLGMLPPGDIRNCIVALSNSEPTILKLLQHRFKEGKLKGQSFGNLLIAAMYDLFGDFEHALKQVGSIFSISGKVLPMTLEDTNLKAELENGEIIFGENIIPKCVLESGNPINKISLVPGNCKPLDETIDEIEKADIIVIGPGSLYTSIIPNLLIDDIAGKIKKSNAKIYYICNIMTQPGETDGYNVKQHIDAIYRHTNENIIDYVIVNNKIISKEILDIYNNKGSSQVIFDEDQEKELQKYNIEIIKDDFIDIEKNYIRHNADKIGRVLEVYNEEKYNS